MTSLPVFILCGGQGLRMGTAHGVPPKPLSIIGSHPILWHVMKLFSLHGCREFVLCTGYRGSEVEAFFARNAEPGSAVGGPLKYLATDDEPWLISFSHSDMCTPSGERLKRAFALTRNDRAFVAYADGLTDVNIKSLLEFHLRHGRTATIMAVTPRLPFGVLALDETGRVLVFEEKPRMEVPVNAGFFVFNRDIGVLWRGDLSLEEDILPDLARSGELMAYQHQGFWYCMDSQKELLHLNQLWATGHAPWKQW